MAQTIFDSCFSHISPEVRSTFGIEDADLVGMVSSEFYSALNNPEITGPATMLDSLVKNEGSQENEAEIEAANRELRIQNYIMIEEMRQLFGGEE